MFINFQLSVAGYGIGFVLLPKTCYMKRFTSYTIALAIFFCSTTACGNKSNSTGGGDSTLTKIDTTLDPADHTNVAKADSTSASSAPEMDTLKSKKRVAPVAKYSSKHK